ncbi:MAG: PaaI family thioesterase [Comamonadaceae bacterium]|nr:PaaI family thioesterase [Comamonadaceae bacterium]
MSPPDCPEGFKPLFRTSPFLDATGPYFYKPLENGFIVGLRVTAKHLNTSGTAHGGLLATLSDVALGYVTAMSQQPPIRMTTANLGLDYVGVAREGDWLQAHVSVVKVGSRLAFANALIAANDVPVATARATFLVIGNAP